MTNRPKYYDSLSHRAKLQVLVNELRVKYPNIEEVFVFNPENSCVILIHPIWPEPVPRLDLQYFANSINRLNITQFIHMHPNRLQAITLTLTNKTIVVYYLYQNLKTPLVLTFVCSSAITLPKMNLSPIHDELVALYS